MNELSQKHLFVWDIFRESVEFFCSHWTILRHGILLGTILGGLSLFLWEVSPFPGSLSILPEELNALLWIPMSFLYIASFDVLLFLAISCHRLILLKDSRDSYCDDFFQAIKGWKFLSFLFLEFPHASTKHWPRELNYFFFFIIVYLGGNLVCMLGQWVLGPLIGIEALEGILPYLTVFPGFCYFLGRFSLICPAVAIDWKQDSESSWEDTLEWSWNQTEAQGWKMALLVGGLPLLLGVFYEVLIIFGIQEVALLDSLVYAFLWFFITPIEIALLSIAFRELTGWSSTSQLS